MPYSTTIIRLLDKVENPLKEILIGILEEIERQKYETINIDDFNELKQIVKELLVTHKETKDEIRNLTEAQKKSEERLTRLETAVQGLIEAQKKSEERLTRLETAVQGLTEAQKRTEERINELAQAQKKTEQELKKLISEHKKTRENLGGLAHSFGYFLENESYKFLPKLLKKDYSVDVVGELTRDFIEISPGKYIEVNILGKGQKGEKEIYIIGECKTQIKKRDVDNFLKNLNKIEHIIKKEIFPLLVTHQTSPKVKSYIKDKKIPLYFSFQFK